METAAPATVQVEFTLAVGPGRLEASLPVPAGDISLTELLPVLQSLSSHIIGSTVGLVEREGHAVSCRAGCGACCRQLVPLTLFEAEALTTWVRTLPPPEQQALERRFHAALLGLRDAGLLERLDRSAGLDPDPAKALAVDYLRAWVPCPFLVDESCSIHPIRPFACREYLVTSPPAFCDDPSQNPVVGVPLPLKLSHVLIQLGAQLEPGSKGWLPLVFLFAWMRTGARPGETIHGPGPELLYEIVKRLGVK